MVAIKSFKGFVTNITTSKLLELTIQARDHSKVKKDTILHNNSLCKILHNTNPIGLEYSRYNPQREGTHFPMICSMPSFNENFY